MLVHAFVASVRTRPEPAVFPVLDGLDEEFADFVGCCFGVAVFAEDDLAEFFYGDLLAFAFTVQAAMRVS